MNVWSYTLRAIQVYIDLITIRKRRDLYNLTVAVRHTQGSDVKVFKNFMDSLEGDD